jgi:hypothetical protein
MTANHRELDLARARQLWAEYQKHNDVSPFISQTAGIDPFRGRVWYGESALAIRKQLDKEGIETPLFFVRVGSDHYLRKGFTSWSFRSMAKVSKRRLLSPPCCDRYWSRASRTFCSSGRKSTVSLVNLPS